MEKVNPARGEVAVKVGGVDLVLACELGSLAAFEAVMNRDMPKPGGVPHGLNEIVMVAAQIPLKLLPEALRCFAIRGDVEKAIAGMSVRDTMAAHNAVRDAVVSRYLEPGGNGEAAGEATA